MTYVKIRSIIEPENKGGDDPIRYSELKRELRERGCLKDSEGKRHEWWYSPITGKHFPVARHDGQEVPPGTLNNIKRDAGLK